jgi:acetoin utilization deacetylase AcuC-like enzyme
MSDAASLAVATSPLLREHRAPEGASHVERPERLDAVLEALDAVEHGRLPTPEPVDDEPLLLVHGNGHLERIAQLAMQNGWADADTFVGTHGDKAARVGVACCLAVADAVATGQATRGFAAVRPPGHHALPDRAMGFCLYANAAIVCRHLQRRHGLERVAVVDFDVHHGNGTQEAFWRDSSVLTISLHGDPHHLWPGSGFSTEVGDGPGEGMCINLPLLTGTDDATLLLAMRDEVLPAVRAFRPDALVVPAGFDGHRDDPLGIWSVTSDGFGEVGHLLAALADEVCGGRMIATLEGGYDLPALHDSVTSFLQALLLTRGAACDAFSRNSQYIANITAPHTVTHVTRD